jgi:uncharacterized protein (TIGR00730 family)
MARLPAKAHHELEFEPLEGDPAHHPLGFSISHYHDLRKDFQLRRRNGTTSPAASVPSPLDPLWAAREKQTMSSKPLAIEARSRLVRNICVFCGSAQGHDLVYEAAARQLGQAMAEAGIDLVYGGGAIGLMGVIARSVLANGGYVTGIIPNFLVGREGLLPGLQESLVVGTMHERKRLMFERADAFVALPGGIGTLEELAEQLSWVQLERHTKPVVIADIAGFWQPLLRLFAHMRERRFIQSSLEVRYLVAEKIEDIVPMIETAAAKAAVLGTRKEAVDPRL